VAFFFVTMTGDSSSLPPLKKSDSESLTAEKKARGWNEQSVLVAMLARAPRVCQKQCARNKHAAHSKLLSVPLMKVFDGCDELPLGPHANRVLVHRRVDNLERHKGGQFEVLQGHADLGGALADHADVCRGGDDFFDTVRALDGACAAKRIRQTVNGGEWVAGKLTK
jgi:hypothetical protein